MEHTTGLGDWPEDFVDENRKYRHTCFQCATPFVGHKHRLVCRVCEAENRRRWDAMTEMEQDAALKKFAEVVAEVFGRHNTMLSGDGGRKGPK